VRFSLPFRIGQEIEFFLGGLANACPPFSQGIVVLNGWPLNALRRDDHYKKGKLAQRQKFGEKNRVFPKKTERCCEGRFSVP
jgi:hypothetical protein